MAALSSSHAPGESKTTTAPREAADPEYDQKTADALAAMRARLELPPSTGVVPSHLEPPVWDPEAQIGRFNRTGETCIRQENAVDGTDLLPARFRLFPKRFLQTEKCS